MKTKETIMNTAAKLTTRREALKLGMAAVAGASLGSLTPKAALNAADVTTSKAASLTKTTGIQTSNRIFVNHLGFHPGFSKFFVITNPAEKTFVIRRAHKNRVNNKGEIVYSGKLTFIDKDLGAGWMGDFSDVRNEGTYVIQCGQVLSRIVTVSKRIYEYPLRTLYNFFNSQRCGNTNDGWNTPCHLNDGISSETGKPMDASGGWHQSGDLRKWTFGTVYGLLGLSNYALKASTRWSRERVTEEIRWGNLYFHKLVRPSGGLMDYVVNPQNWIGPRIVQVTDAPPTSSFLFVASQALICRVFKESDPDYFRSCSSMAERVWNYLHSSVAMNRIYTVPPGNDHPEFFTYWFKGINPDSSLWHGYAVLAAAEMYKSTGNKVWGDRAAFHANALVDLQFVGENAKDLLDGCFITAPGNNEIRSNIGELESFGPLGLCHLIELFPEHNDSSRWKVAVEKHADNLLLTSARNPWGLIAPYKFNYPEKNTRSDGSGFYSYFWQYLWRLGSNVQIAACALFLKQAAAITSQKKFLDTACRQIDWILGCNPLDRSTAEGIGRNQPERLINTFEFFPPVPQIPGAVVTGVPGDENDNPCEFDGATNSEYDMPPTSLLMWLMSELSAHY